MAEQKKNYTRAELDAMPKGEVRVLIAQDVLDAIASKRLVTGFGSYMTCSGFNTESEAYKPTQGCEVCNIGAIFVCAVDRFNALLTADVLYAGDVDEDGDAGAHFMLRYLSPWFSGKQLRLIETAFEDEYCGDELTGGCLGVGASQIVAETPTKKQQARALRFHERTAEAVGRYHVTSDHMMKAIMENIIRNKGSFRP